MYINKKEESDFYRQKLDATFLLAHYSTTTSEMKPLRVLKLLTRSAVPQLAKSGVRSVGTGAAAGRVANTSVSFNDRSINACVLLPPSRTSGQYFCDIPHRIQPRTNVRTKRGSRLACRPGRQKEMTPQASTATPTAARPGSGMRSWSWRRSTRLRPRSSESSKYIRPLRRTVKPQQVSFPVRTLTSATWIGNSSCTTTRRGKIPMRGGI